jgi:hypothetical protein
VDQVLDAIEALKESIQERIESIEDGSYWDENGKTVSPRGTYSGSTF